MKQKFFLLPLNIKQFDEDLTLDVVKQFLTDNKDNEHVKAFVGELSTPTAEGVKGFLETDEGKKLIQPRLDQHFTKGIETWKANNLESLIGEEVKKRNPDKTPEQAQIEKLQKQIEDAEKARHREALVNKALKVAKEKNLPDGIIDFFIGEGEEKTLENLTKFEETYTKGVQAAVETKFKESGRHFPGNSSGGGADDDYGKNLAKDFAKNNEGLEKAQQNYFD